MIRSTLLASFALITSCAFADVTLQFSQLSVGRATGFGNSAGVATDNMRWGIVVSTTNAAFNGGTYDVFDSDVSGFLSVGGLVTDDYYVSSGLFTSTLGATGTSPNRDPGGAGGITSLNPVPFGGASNIGLADPFNIIWFESAVQTEGTKYGMMSNPLFVIPANGTGTSFAPIVGVDSGVFGGSTADPVKPANFSFAAVPEPSRMILLAFGLVGVIFRRRR